MKKLILIIFITNILFANDYAYTNQNSGKIDMHGGKSDNLINKKGSLSDINSNNLTNKVKKKKEPETEVLEEKEFKDLKDLGL